MRISVSSRLGVGSTTRRIQPEEPTRPPHAERELTGDGPHQRMFARELQAFFFEDLLQDDLVQRQIGYQLLEFAVLVLQAAATAGFRPLLFFMPAPSSVGGLQTNRMFQLQPVSYFGRRSVRDRRQNFSG
jgi:hypothetical protein